MLNATITEELNRASTGSLEVDAIFEGRTILSSLMVGDVDDECVSFLDADGARVTVLNDKVFGVIVHSQQPQWLTRELDLSGKTSSRREREPATSGAR